MNNGRVQPAIKELSITFDSTDDSTKDAAVCPGPYFKAGERGCTEIRYHYTDSVLIIILETTTGIREYHYPVDTLARVRVLS